jgi:hypothetical protein
MCRCMDGFLLCSAVGSSGAVLMRCRISVPIYQLHASLSKTKEVAFVEENSQIRKKSSGFPSSALLLLWVAVEGTVKPITREPSTLACVRHSVNGKNASWLFFVCFIYNAMSVLTELFLAFSPANGGRFTHTHTHFTFIRQSTKPIAKALVLAKTQLRNPHRPLRKCEDKNSAPSWRKLKL